MAKYKDFEPNWYHGNVPPDSYRSIFKWGKPPDIKIPRESLYKLMKAQFDLTDEDFKEYSEDLGLDTVRFDIPTKLTAPQLARFADLVGKDFVRTDDYARLSVAYGKTMYDLLRIRNKIVENVPDAVLYPDTKEQIEAIVAFCAA
ncbi:MAG: FAD-binding oxidoreductase, partial [Spirochaetaceae bacterium]|nr:FAD-binding oxidoreductase [Spirochaetaceae bacterium]